MLSSNYLWRELFLSFTKPFKQVLSLICTSSILPLGKQCRDKLNRLKISNKQTTSIFVERLPVTDNGTGFSL